MKSLVFFVLTAMIVTQPYVATTRSLTFETVNDADTISFDPSKISESRLRELILLSPFIVDYINDRRNNNFRAVGSMIGTTPYKRLTALPLELCITGLPAYSNCETNNIANLNFLHNGEVNLKRSERGLCWLQHLDHPRELDSVVRYVERWLSLSTWIEEARLKYYSTWDERPLKDVHDGIDPAQLCSEAFARLASADSKEEKYRIVRFDWANCVIRTIDRQLGPYPINEWKSFLQAYGITEEYKQKGPD